MLTNDLFRRLRYALVLDDRTTQRLIQLGGGESDEVQVAAWRAKEGDSGSLPCPDPVIGQLLTGFTVDRRGPPPAHLPVRAEPSGPISNNHVLKQVRIALELKDEDVHRLIETGGGKLSRSEVNALFRKPGSRNFRACGDQVLRWFLAGLAASRDR